MEKLGTASRLCNRTDLNFTGGRRTDMDILMDRTAASPSKEYNVQRSNF